MGYISPDFIKSKIANRVDSAQAVAQAQAESAFDNFATRYESHIFDSLVKKGTPAKEAKLLSTSYGLYQIMGFNLKTMGIDVTKEGRAGLYLASPTEQINSYVTFSQNLKSVYPKQNDFLAAYNGGDTAVKALNEKGYYGKAEPYVYKVKSILNTVTPDDRIRYNKYQDNTEDIGILIPGVVIAAVIYGLRQWSKAS